MPKARTNDHGLGRELVEAWSRPIQPQANKRGPYMSKYVEMKLEIERLQAQLEEVRQEEMEAEIIEIKKKVIAFGIRPEQIFSQEDTQRTMTRAGRVYKVKPREAKYALDGKTWSGAGSTPKWFTDALVSGKTPEDLIIKKPAKTGLSTG